MSLTMSAHMALSMSAPVSPSSDTVESVNVAPAQGISLQAPRFDHGPAGRDRPNDVERRSRSDTPDVPDAPRNGALVVAAMAFSTVRVRRPGVEKEQQVRETLAEVRWLLDDSWKNDIGKKELERARQLIDRMGADGRFVISRVPDPLIAPWIRETRGWLDGFPYGEGSEHLAWLASQLAPSQAQRFADQLVMHAHGANGNKAAIYRAAAGGGVAGHVLARDPDRSDVLTALTGDEALERLLVDAQLHERHLTALVTSEVPAAARAEMWLATGTILESWAPGTEVAPVQVVPAMADLIDGETLAHLRRHHSSRSDELIPLMQHLLASDLLSLRSVAGSPADYPTRFEDPVFAADMGLFVGLAAEAVTRTAGSADSDHAAAVRLAKALLALSGAPALAAVGGSWLLDETKARAGSRRSADADRLRKELYHLALPPGAGDAATVAYHVAFAGVVP